MKKPLHNWITTYDPIGGGIQVCCEANKILINKEKDICLKNVLHTVKWKSLKRLW